MVRIFKDPKEAEKVEEERKSFLSVKNELKMRAAAARCRFPFRDYDLKMRAAAAAARVLQIILK